MNEELRIKDRRIRVPRLFRQQLVLFFLSAKDLSAVGSINEVTSKPLAFHQSQNDSIMVEDRQRPNASISSKAAPSKPQAFYRNEEFCVSLVYENDTTV